VEAVKSQHGQNVQKALAETEASVTDEVARRPILQQRPNLGVVPAAGAESQVDQRLVGAGQCGRQKGQAGKLEAEQRR